MTNKKIILTVSALLMLATIVAGVCRYAQTQYEEGYDSGRNEGYDVGYDDWDKVYIDEIDKFLRVVGKGKIKGYSMTLEKDNVD